MTSTGTETLSNGELKHVASLRFGFRSTEPAGISLTTVFPRSVDCIENGVPLLPILEILPWNPDDTASLIKAFIRVKTFLEIYPRGSLSFGNLSQLGMPDNSGQYKTLFDFLIYYLKYQTFSGNAFTEMRADYGNKLCLLLKSRPNVFLGAFGAFKDNFLRQIVEEYGQDYRAAYPACDVPETVLKHYQNEKVERDFPPFMTTFRACLKTAGSMKECLAKDDAPVDRNNCATQPCISKPPEVALFELYDMRYSEIVSTKNNMLAEIKTIKPDECPALRDSEEERAFILWWQGHANRILSKPVMCSSPDWQAELSRSLDEERKTFACASERTIQDVQSPLDVPSSLSLLSTFRCGKPIYINKTVISKTWYYFSDQSEKLAAKLQRYRADIGSQKADPLIGALEMFAKVKHAMCGTLDEKSCLAEYDLWQDYWRLAGQFSTIFDPSLLNGSIKENVENLTKLDNVLIDMAICDLLEDKILSEKSGYDRQSYCDEHGLETYRITKPANLGQSIERTELLNSNSFSYEFDETGCGDLIKIPYDNP